MANASAHQHDVWNADVDGDTVSVGAEESSGVQQVGNAPDGSDEDNGGGPGPSGPLVHSRWVPDCFGSSPYDE
ncbi:MAG TPA: hypothetical protein VFZ85_01685, partial [Jiangellaceae bacterium]